MKRSTRNKLEIRRRHVKTEYIGNLTMGTAALTQAAIVPKRPVEVTLTREEKVNFARAMLAEAFS